MRGSAGSDAGRAAIGGEPGTGPSEPAGDEAHGVAVLLEGADGASGGGGGDEGMVGAGGLIDSEDAAGGGGVDDGAFPATDGLDGARVEVASIGNGAAADVEGGEGQNVGAGGG